MSVALSALIGGTVLSGAGNASGALSPDTTALLNNFLNLLTLCVMLYMQHHGAKEKTVQVVKETAHSAAEAAASAAVVASDAARITKELGSLVRENRPERLTDGQHH